MMKVKTERWNLDLIDDKSLDYLQNLEQKIGRKLAKEKKNLWETKY